MNPGWFSAPPRLSEDESEEERDFALAAARAALRELAPEEAGLGARLQAVQFLCAHAAAMDWQGRANSPFVPEPARLIAQRFARQMMALTTRQLAMLTRLKAERRREKEAAERHAWRAREHATREQLARGNGLTAELERMLTAGVDVDAMLEGAAGAEPDGAAGQQGPS